MHLLLPPSETKRSGGRRPFAQDSLAWAERLGGVRARVRTALEAVSADESAAVKALKLGVKNRDERHRNLRLDESGAMPAIERYTGVLYDALDVFSVDGEADEESIDAAQLADRGAARRWIDVHVFVQSALFGLVRATDAIPAYRLSASSRLPRLGAPLARVWAPSHRGLLGGIGGVEGGLGGGDYVLDLRSKDYAELAPPDTLGAARTDFVEVMARGEDGEVRALNHFNKAAKGDLVRRLARSTADIANRAELLDWARENGVEIEAAGTARTVRLITRQGVPAAKG